MIKRLLLVTLAACTLCGCSFGRTKYQCPAPTGAACMPVDALYKLTDDPGRDGLEAATGLFTDGSAPSPAAAQARHGRQATMRGAQAAQGSGQPVRPTPQEGSVVPVRQAARVMRIWIAPWEDTAGNLHMAGRVFAEIAAPRWSVGAQARQKPKSFYPLQVEEAPNKSNGTVPGDGVVTPVGN